MMPFRLSRRRLLATASLLAVPMGVGKATAAEGDFGGFLAGVRRDALAQGIRPGTVDFVLRSVEYLPRVIELDRKQPERRLSFAEFRCRPFYRPNIDRPVPRASVAGRLAWVIANAAANAGKRGLLKENA